MSQLKKLQFTIVFVVLTFNLFAQELSLDQGSTNTKNYYEEIDFEIVHDKIVVPVVINNITYKFLLDTGAPNVISKRLLQAINAEKTEKIAIADANNQVDTLEMVSVKSIGLKSIKFENNVAIVSDLDNHPILKCYKLDGFIGSNLFQNSILKINLSDKKITITNDIKKLKLKTKPTKLKLIGKQKSPYIKIVFTGKDGQEGVDHVLVDTGMDGFYDISNRAYAVFSKELIFEELSRSQGSSSIGLFGTSPMKEQILIKSNLLKINEATFENLITSTTDDDNSRLGMDLLKYGAITIDFINKKFYFEAESKFDLNDKAPIFSPTIIENKFVVGFVWDKSYHDQLKFGDEIIRIDNYKLSDMDFCDIIKLKNIRRNKQSYEMEVKSENNQIRLIKIEN